MRALGLVIGDGHSAAEFGRQALEWRHFLERRGDDAALVVLPVATLALPRRLDRVLLALAKDTGLRQVAFFCHGWSSAIQLCPAARVHELARAIRAASADTAPVVTLYACTTGSDTDAKTPERGEGPHGDAPGGDGGFADQLRDALCAEGAVDCIVDAHTVEGHTTRNPYVRRFAGCGVATGGVGGQWLVTPRSALWDRWVHAVKGELRWRFPTMMLGEIHAELANAKAA